MPFVTTDNMHEQMRAYMTELAMAAIDEEGPMRETARQIARSVISQYADTNPGEPYIALIQDLNLARLAAMHNQMIFGLREEFWPEWTVDPLETPSDVLSRSLVEYSYSMIKWNDIAKHYLHSALEEIADAIAEQVMTTAPQVTIPLINVQPFADPADPPPAAPPIEPIMSTWV